MIVSGEVPCCSKTSAAREKIPARRHSKVPRRPVSYFLLQSAGSAAARGGRRVFSLRSALLLVQTILQGVGIVYRTDVFFFSLSFFFFLLASTAILLCQCLKMAKGNQQTSKKKQKRKAVTNTFVFPLKKKKKKQCFPLIYFCTTGGSRFSDAFTSPGEVCRGENPPHKHLEVQEKQRQRRLAVSGVQLAEGASGDFAEPTFTQFSSKIRNTFFFFQYIFHPAAAARVRRQQMARG